MVNRILLYNAQNGCLYFTPIRLPKIFATPNERATPRLFSRQPRSAAPTFGPNPVFISSPSGIALRTRDDTPAGPDRLLWWRFRPFRYDAVDDSKLRPFAVAVGKAETVSRIRGSDACAHCPRGDLFISGARPGLICAGLRGDTGLGVGRVTVAPFSLLISGTQLGDGCGP
jgi:hypothetical protein